MDTVAWRGRTLAFLTVRFDRFWSARIWDLDSQEEIPTNEAYQLHPSQADKILHGLTTHKTEQTIRFAFAGQYGKVMVADFQGGLTKKEAQRRPYEEWHSPHGTGYTNCLAAHPTGEKVLLAAGSEHGHLTVWNFFTGEIEGSRKLAHLDGVSALSFRNSHAGTVLLSAGLDGTLRVWSTDLAELVVIETGEPILTALWVSENEIVLGGSGGMLKVMLPGPLLF